MKKYIVLFLLLGFQTFSQNIKFDTNSFLLGIMEDYDCRCIPLEYKDFSSYIGSVDKSLSQLFLDSISKHFNVPKEEIIVKENNSFYHSKIAKKINENYIVEKDRDIEFVPDESDKGYVIYIHELNEKKFDSKSKKISFLTGVFYNCGKFLNGEVIFKTANSNNFNVAVHFISRLGFEYCEKVKPEYNIPTVQEVRFTPSKEYLDYFIILESKRQKGW